MGQAYLKTTLELEGSQSWAPTKAKWTNPGNQTAYLILKSKKSKNQVVNLKDEDDI